ncbi:MAG TPA: DinB family protein [Terriglobales bacterium]|nr:DinB family protein [Terriglobales bacterium]
MATAQQGPTPEFVLVYRQMLLDGFTREVQTTRKVIAAIPEAKRDYRPDPHARTAWELAWHMAKSDVEFLDGIADLSFEKENRDPEPKNVRELLEWYQSNYDRAAERVRKMTPQQLLTPVGFFGVFNLPAVFYLGFLNNHSIHHRGALATYLRPMGAKCPSIYGGSYDEPFEAAA